MTKRKCTIYNFAGDAKLAPSLTEYNNLQIESIDEADIIKGLFNTWKQENLTDNLTLENATDPNLMEWFGVLCNKEIVGFYAIDKRMQLLTILYVANNHRHKGLASKIVQASKCSGIQLGFYNQQSLKKTKDAFKDIGYTEHRVLVFKLPTMRMAVAEVLAKPETSMHVNIPGLEYISSDDKNLVRV